MNQVNFVINGHNYPITCKEGQEERLLFLQSVINKKENEILTAFRGNITHEMLMMMLAVVLSDELTSKEKNTTSPMIDPTEIDEIDKKIKGLAHSLDLLSLKI